MVVVIEVVKLRYKNGAVAPLKERRRGDVETARVGGGVVSGRHRSFQSMSSPHGQLHRRLQNPSFVDLFPRRYRALKAKGLTTQLRSRATAGLAPPKRSRLPKYNPSTCGSEAPTNSASRVQGQGACPYFQCARESTMATTFP